MKKIIYLGIALVMLFSMAGLSACDLDLGLAAYKTTAKSEITSHVQGLTQTNYTPANWTLIEQRADEGKTAVEAAESKSSVDTAVTTAKADIDAVEQKDEVEDFVLTISVEKTTLPQGEDFAVSVTLKNNGEKEYEILYSRLFWQEVDGVRLESPISPPWLVRTQLFEANSVFCRDTEEDPFEGLYFDYNDWLLGSDFGAGAHELTFVATFWLQDEQPIEIKSNTVALTVEKDSEIVEVETADMIELHTWYFTSGLPNNAIKLNHTDDNVIFACSVDNGQFGFGMNGLKTMIANSGDTLYWQDVDAEVSVIGHAFFETVLKADNNIIGYAVVRINATTYMWYNATILKAALFPKIDDEYQNITEEYVKAAIEKVKNEKTHASGDKEDDMVLSDELKAIILQDLFEQFVKPSKPDAVNNLSILAYYGTYNECVVLTTSLDLRTATGIMPMVVGGVTFYINMYQIRTWHEGSFYSLQEAYDNGYLTQENLEHIKNNFEIGGI